MVSVLTLPHPLLNKSYDEDIFETLAYNVNGVKHFVFLTNGNRQITKNVDTYQAHLQEMPESTTGLSNVRPAKK
jgi:hypothetical protein